MPPFLKRDEDDNARAEKDERKRREQAEKEERKRQAEADKAAKAFASSPQGSARAAFERGDHIFQYAHAVDTQTAVVVAMVGSASPSRTSDPSTILNAVAREGWDLVTGSFVFQEQGQQSRDKFMSSGQNVAIRGRTMGYYLFRRCPEIRVDPAQMAAVTVEPDPEPETPL